MKILIAPAEFYFKPGNYHVTYNVLKRVPAKFKVLCGFVHPNIKKILTNSEIYEIRGPFFLYPFKIVTYGLKFRIFLSWRGFSLCQDEQIHIKL